MQNLPSLSISECCTQKRNRKIQLIQPSECGGHESGMIHLLPSPSQTWQWTITQKHKNPHGKTIIIYNRGFSWIFQPCITVSGIDP